MLNLLGELVAHVVGEGLLHAFFTRTVQRWFWPIGAVIGCVVSFGRGTYTTWWVWAILLVSTIWLAINVSQIARDRHT